jgi:hypothetical protein
VYHLDLLVNSPYFHTLTGPQLFDTFDLRGGPRVRGQDLAYYVANDVVQVGPLRVRLGFFCVLSLRVLAAAASASFSDSPVVVLLQQFGLVFLAGSISCLSLVSYEFGLYRCSPTTAAFGLTFPVVVVAFCLLSGAPASPGRTLVLFLAYVMIWHHFVHETLLRDGAWPDLCRRRKRTAPRTTGG